MQEGLDRSHLASSVRGATEGLQRERRESVGEVVEVDGVVDAVAGGRDCAEGAGGCVGRKEADGLVERRGGCCCWERESRWDGDEVLVS